jgi:hypothetical protein
MIADRVMTSHRFADFIGAGLQLIRIRREVSISASGIREFA